MSDAAVREEVLDPTRSFLVNAPAGSGKTELLIQRYLRLLSCVQQPESVVALTFTRKAAAEMKERVLKALRAARNNQPLRSEYEQTTRSLALDALARSDGFGWDILEDTNRLTIGTIDSFCAGLTRQLPVLAGLGSNPQVVEFAGELYRLAARRAIVAFAETENLQPQFREIALHFDSKLDWLESLVADLLGRRDRWKRQLEEAGGAGDFRSTINNALRCHVEARMAAALALWPAGLDHPKPGTSLEFDYPLWQSFAVQNLRKDSKDPRVGPHRAVLADAPDFCRRLRSFQANPTLEISEAEWTLILNFASLLRVAELKLEEVFRDRGQVDFTHIASAAVAALRTGGQPSELALRLDYRIEHLLIDEFQDTSYVQYELVQGLTAEWSAGDNRTLFVVGDPQQSIYRFRDAEVQLFINARANRAIGTVPLEVRSLTRNFRSTPALVDWVNQRFLALRPQNPSEEQEAVFSPAEAAVSAPGRPPLLHPFVEDDGSGEAGQVIQIVRQAIAAGDRKIAILVRSRTNLLKILPALRDANIRFEAVDLAGLAEEQHILDLLSLTRSLHHPMDRVSWLAVLRSPLCGLTLVDLAAFCEDSPHAAIPDLLREDTRLQRLSPAGHARILAARDVLLPALAGFGRAPVSRLVESAWMALGGYTAYASRATDIESFFDLLEETERSGVVEDFPLLLEKLATLFARHPVSAETRVQVMTIHKAKGLEFDTVILPGLNKGVRPTDQELLIWAEETGPQNGTTLLLAGKPQAGASSEYYSLVHAQSVNQDKAEQERLFYVATTPAKHSLHLLASVNLKQDGGISKPENFLALIWPWAEPFFQAAVQAQPVQARAANASAVPSQGSPAVALGRSAVLTRLPADWRLPAAEPALPVPAIARRAVTRDARPSFDWVSETGRHVGTIVHEFLHRFAEEGLSAWDTVRLDGMKRFIEEELRLLGVAAAERGQAVHRVLQALSNVLSSRRGSWVLGPHRSAQSEWAVSGLVSGKLVNVRIDRTFLDAEGVRWIVDYKTSTHEGAHRDRFLLQERQRYEQQLSAYGQLLRFQDENAPVKAGLYFPLLDDWIDWEVDTAAALVVR